MQQTRSLHVVISMQLIKHTSMCYYNMFIIQDKMMQWSSTAWLWVRPSETQCATKCRQRALVFFCATGYDIVNHHQNTWKTTFQREPPNSTSGSNTLKLSNKSFILKVESNCYKWAEHEEWSKSTSMQDELAFGFELWACLPKLHKSAVKTIPFAVWRFLNCPITH